MNNNTLPAADHDTPGLNNTSFAYHMTTATASFLDAVATVGSTRKALLVLARQCAEDAIKLSGLEEERLMAAKFLEALDELYGKGLHV